MMSDTVNLMLIWCLGLALGGFFFVGLWWTVQKSIRSAHPAWWLLSSLLVRMTVTIAGFYLVVSHEMANASLLRLLICLFGFICARLITARVVAKMTARLDTPVQQVAAIEQHNPHEGSQHAP